MNRLIRRTLYAGSAACCGALLWGANASAAGDDGAGGLLDQVQTAVVGNSTDQGADASIHNEQINLNAPIAVLSPAANGGDVSQSNEATNPADASNDNSTDQTVGQDQTADATNDGHGSVEGSQDQSADVANDTDQQADASVDNRQVNVNVPVAVLSPHANGGDVSQSNEATNTAEATNDNSTDQAVAQEQTAAATTEGSDHGTAGLAAVDEGQSADVTNETAQASPSDVTNEQANTNESATSGDVSQSNTADNTAEAANDNSTDQAVAQAQTSDATATGTGTDTDSWSEQRDHEAPSVAAVTQDQAAHVANETTQDATSSVGNDQANSNESAPLAHRTDRDTDHWTKQSTGHDDGSGNHEVPATGDVSQSNTATNTADTANTNDTVQDVVQDQSAAAATTGHDGADWQRSSNDHTTPTAADVTQDQAAHVANETTQHATTNVGNDQANSNESAPSDHGTDHDADPWTKQSTGHDDGSGNHEVPATGDVSQSNTATNTADAANANSTTQNVAQGQTADATVSDDGDREHDRGDSHGKRHDGNAVEDTWCDTGHGGQHGGPADVDQAQAADVSNGTQQSADADVDNHQDNTNRAPHGDVDQSNTADNTATATNDDDTAQAVLQGQLATVLRSLTN